MPTREGLSNADVALYALYKLGGATKKIHTELIAWEAYNFSEERFSWTLPEFRKRGFPDKATVRYALESAKKEKLVKGRAGRDKAGSESEGWQFTPTGVEWFLSNEERIKDILRVEKPISSALPKHQAERFIKKMHSEKIFKLYQEKLSLDEASIYDFTDMLNCSPDASRDVIRQKFDLLKSTAISINNQDIWLFLEKCEKKFSGLLVN
ncbi:MAG: hypothetical protein KKC39_01035 [Candidatus Omnitrophica bacterium]|nr:hypothetical protein [Candidatus Omnitrophota bacterium]